MAAIDLLADDEPVDLLAEEPNKNESRGMKALKGIGEDWLHFGRNLASGGLEGLRGIGNIPHQLHLPYAPYFEPTDFRKMVGLNKNASLSDKLIEGIGQFAPALLAPEAKLDPAIVTGILRLDVPIAIKGSPIIAVAPVVAPLFESVN